MHTFWCEVSISDYVCDFVYKALFHNLGNAQGVRLNSECVGGEKNTYSTQTNKLLCHADFLFIIIQNVQKKHIVQQWS